MGGLFTIKASAKWPNCKCKGTKYTFKFKKQHLSSWLFMYSWKNSLYLDQTTSFIFPFKSFFMFLSRVMRRKLHTVNLWEEDPDHVQLMFCAEKDFKWNPLVSWLYISVLCSGAVELWGHNTTVWFPVCVIPSGWPTLHFIGLQLNLSDPLHLYRSSSFTSSSSFPICPPPLPCFSSSLSSVHLFSARSIA